METLGLNGTYQREDGSRDERDRESSERADEEDVKLLRFRSKKHEVVVVPDRKYILCVVHDAAGSGGVSGAAPGGLRGSR